MPERQKLPTHIEKIIRHHCWNIGISFQGLTSIEIKEFSANDFQIKFKELQGPVHEVQISKILEEVKFGVQDRKVYRPPFMSITRLADFLFSKPTYDLFIYPRLQMATSEYFEALHAGHKRKAAWIKIRESVGICLSIMLQLGVSIAKTAVKLWKISGS